MSSIGRCHKIVLASRSLCRREGARPKLGDLVRWTMRSTNQPGENRIMARRLLTGAAVSGAVLAFSALAAHAEHFQATFSGFQELGAQNAETGAILSEGT